MAGLLTHRKSEIVSVDAADVAQRRAVRVVSRESRRVDPGRVPSPRQAAAAWRALGQASVGLGERRQRSRLLGARGVRSSERQRGAVTASRRPSAAEWASRTATKDGRKLTAEAATGTSAWCFSVARLPLPESHADGVQWVAFLSLPIDEQVKRFESSGHQQVIREVLAARHDPTSKRWRRKYFCIEEVVTEWATQLQSGRPHREAQDCIRQIEKLSWDAKLADADREVQASQWEVSRRRLITCLREALITGCGLKRLLNRFYNAVDDKNKRVGTYVKSILEDPALVNSNFAPLAYDVLMYQLRSRPPLGRSRTSRVSGRGRALPPHPYQHGASHGRGRPSLG